MSDANAKPVAGASEPHELEERCALAVAQFFGENDSPLDAARAVLALVRKEQEAEWQDIMLSGVEGWWLSHTAKETSNG